MSCSTLEHDSSKDGVRGPSRFAGVDLVPPALGLEAVIQTAIPWEGREYVLLDMLTPHLAEYDLILIDCRPGIDLSVTNALTAARWLLVPVECSFMALDGYEHVHALRQRLNVRINRELDLLGLLPTRYRSGTAHAQAALEEIQQPGEQVQHVPDEQIEDSPYQARQPFGDADVKDLAQGMREAGFQGVLIVRLHGDPAKRRRGLVQLVYGHRRRAAWRHVCAERGQPCLLPVVVRNMSDAQMLTIGAQENLQRQDLDPLEEAQIVAWHEQVFFDKNQAELGAMLGKSSDWVSVRSRIYKLPDVLKERLRQRP